MAEDLKSEVEAVLARGLEGPSELKPKDGYPRVQSTADDRAIVDWRLSDGSVSLLESGLPACEVILANAGYDVQLVDSGERILVARGSSRATS